LQGLQFLNPGAVDALKTFDKRAADLSGLEPHKLIAEPNCGAGGRQNPVRTP
jgi:hypothetical protein